MGDKPADDPSDVLPINFGLKPNPRATIDFVVRAVGGPPVAAAIILDVFRERTSVTRPKRRRRAPRPIRPR